MRGALAIVLLSVLSAGCAQPPKVEEEAPPPQAALPAECDGGTGCAGSTCPAEITAAQSAAPADACPKFGEFQGGVDVYSWNTFVALNWPANVADCTADTGKSILDGTGPVVWETFTNDTDLFVAPGQQPAAWCANSFDAPRLFGHNTKTSPALIAASAADQDMQSILEAVGGPLTDQNGRFVRYQKLVNYDEYQYITGNDLWNKAGQQGKTIAFPQQPFGAMEVKAAWKVLSDKEIAGGRFYMTEGIVFNDAQGSPSPGKNPVTLGLVGLHIIHKTVTQKTWFWSTFEHVDNTTSSFFNPHCTDCVDNQQTAAKPYTELNPDGTPINDPVQVTRVNPMDTGDLNAYYQGLLAGSVWANYELISTQWATGGAPGGTPAVLANTTLETYIQGDSSCLGCHKHAQTTAKVSADFSFLLGEAQ